MDFPHLAQKVQQVAMLDTAKRIMYCDNPLWIKTNSSQAFITDIERLVRATRMGSRSCMGLIGISGIGKTTMIEQIELRLNTPEATPILTIDLSDYGRHIDLQQVFLSHLGFTESVKSLCTASGINRIAERIKQMQLAVCILDEGNALAGVKNMLLQPNYTFLRAMANRDFGISLVIAGTEDLKVFLSIDPQLRSRFGLWEIPQWEADGEDFSRFLKAFVRFIPLREVSILDTKEIQETLVLRCRGSTRDIVKVLICAAKLAIELGYECIDEELLEVCLETRLPGFLE
ncbi:MULTISPECIES: TniB family NTP-binding protein [unclassified Pseudomonas]|uniref:TniB family NTP-binding protein n=1 Tax=unclassified Pseudomonas TaxID=196821 RepID=UPI001413761A|nr:MULTISPECIES: TniB family NTP-binding protein [unclassified Pseudomonas]NBB33349.1 AAA family ATPase [Pseudomonas sp. BC115LW]WNF58561.1 TniB family NTP-binding protein [Pseudomonas sp. SG20052]